MAIRQLYYCIVALLSLAVMSARLAQLRASKEYNSRLAEGLENLLHVRNSTLGKIFAISLPERADKRDGMTVAASLSDLSIKFLDGIHGEDVSSKALPYGFMRKATVAGSWRAHMNAAARMLEDNIQSALILEDDADWDVAVKYQMTEFARGSRYLLNTPPESQPESPYGDDWDMLWVGHCGVLEQRSDSRRWIISNDLTVEPSEHHKENVDTPTLEPFGKEHTRMVFKSANGCCVAGYALSLSGARKTLNMMSLRPWDGPVDWGWNELCKYGITNFTCISPFPQIIGVHRPAGNQSRWSDIETTALNDDSMGKAHSLHLVFPTRLNIEKLLASSTNFLSQFPEGTETLEVEFERIIQFNGHPDALPFELLPIPKL